MASEKESESMKWLEHFKLCSINPELVTAWKYVFANSRYAGLVEIEKIGMDQVELIPNSALIIPGNSFGFLTPQDDELHSKAIELFGSNLQDKLTSIIHEKHNSELLVGESVHLPLPTHKHHLIYTPTRRIDTGKVNRVSTLLSLRAALQRVRKLNKDSAVRINSLIGAVALEDQIPPIRVAVQMKVALDAVLFNKCPFFRAPENLAHPLSLDSALSRLKEKSELDTNTYLINCML